ncbi:MAG: hypothetical protein ACE14L_05815 [Terriglobales bacterium]
MGTATAVGRKQHLEWSHWFHCESSFDLSLVPEVPGIFAVGHEEPGRKLAIIRIETADNLFHALNQLFAANCPLRQQFKSGQCLLRYAGVPDDATRRAAISALQAWLTEGVLSAVAEDFLATAGTHPFRNKSD